MEQFRGIIPPVVTLFDDSGEVDMDANMQLADWLIDKRVDGILLMGSTGEFSSLTSKERKQFASEMTKHINGRIPVLIGTGSTSLKETIDLSRHAETIGANGVLIVNPYYWNFTDEQLYQYYSAVAKAISLPILLYNIPQLTGQNLSSDLVCRLAANHQNIVGIKETVIDIGHIRNIILSVQQVRHDFTVFSAFDEHMLPAPQIGATGSINGTSIFVPELSVDLYRSYQNGEYGKAIELHEKLAELMPIYQYSTPLFTAIKEAVHQRVLRRNTGTRLPCIPTSNELKSKVRKLLEESGLI